jgi:hypothetical protein
MTCCNTYELKDEDVLVETADADRKYQLFISNFQTVVLCL